MSLDRNAAPQNPLNRAEVEDLMVEFARALDILDGAADARTCTADGLFDGIGFRILGREALEAGVLANLVRYARRWHRIANHGIEVDGDEARMRASALGEHALSEDALGRHADLAGWSDCDVKRTALGCRFAHVRVTESWVAGEPDLPHWRPERARAGVS